MDFNQLDIRRFLIDALPGRFSRLSPSEFESLIQYLFQVDGYEVEKIHGKSDPTTNLIAKKDHTTLVIRVMRNLPEQIVGDREVQEALVARDFYDADQSWIITTSGFSKEAKTLAENSEIELWDWEALNIALSELFFEGKTYQEYAEHHPPTMIYSDGEPPLKLKAKWEAQEGVGVKWYNLSLTIANPTNENIYIHLDLPVLIDKQKNQISAEKWAEEEFVAGIIYAGASVHTNALFKTSRLGERPPGGRIIMTCHEREPRLTHHLHARLKGEACYFVSYVYSRQSPEYLLMTKFRDEVLIRNRLGRVFIELYYWVSPFLVAHAHEVRWLDSLIKRIAKFGTNKVRTYYSEKKLK